jgi:hypothetical protein
MDTPQIETLRYGAISFEMTLIAERHCGPRTFITQTMTAIAVMRRAASRSSGASSVNENADPERYCTDCKQPLAGLAAPMLNDSTWAMLARKDENLCADCFFVRVSKRRIAVTLADLLPMPLRPISPPLFLLICLLTMGHWPLPRTWLDDARMARDSAAPASGRR